MDKFGRIYRLRTLLRARRTPIAREELMRELECSEPTFYRLVAVMRNYLNAPIERDELAAFYKVGERDMLDHALEVLGLRRIAER